MEVTLDGERDIPVGLPVVTADGERIGYVLGGDADQLFIGNGVLFHQNYAIDLSDLERAPDGTLALKLTKVQFEERLRCTRSTDSQARSLGNGTG